MDLRPHLGKGIWALLDKSFTGVYGLAVVFLLIGKLPRGEYGIYALTFTMVNVALLFNKGFILFPMTKYEAEDIARPRLLGSAFVFSLASMISFGVVIFLLAPAFSNLFRAPELEPLLRLTPLVMLAFFFRDFSVAYLMAHRRVKLLTVLDAVYFLGVAFGFGLLNFLGLFERALAPVWVHIVSAAVCSILALILLVKELKLEIRPVVSDLRKITHFGRYSLSLSIGEISFFQLDLLMLGYFIDPLAVAVYQAAKQPFRFYSLLTQSVNLLIFPGASKLQAQGRLEDVKALFEKVTAYYLIGMLFLNLLLFAGANILLDIFYGGKYPDSAAIFRLLLVFSFFEPLYNISVGVLYGLGKPDKAFKPLALGIPLFILLNALLIPVFSGKGAALTFGITFMYLALRLLKALKSEVGISFRSSARYLRNIPGIIKNLPAFIGENLRKAAK